MAENSLGFIGVHVGAGNHSHAKKSEYENACKRACQKAIEALQQSKTASEALVIAIKILEDCPLTNAGIGSNLNFDGDVECDASIMDGQTDSFGAVGALQGVRNPIVVAKKLVEEQNTAYPSGRVPPMFLCGDGAHNWAVKHGVLGISRKSMITDNSLKSFKKYFNCAKQEEEGNKKKSVKKCKLDDSDESLLDTVGAVCLDKDGNICSGVSSGGLLLKYPGRVGQAAVYGAGCWASNPTKNYPVGIACSSSGCGEELMKTLLCKECADLCSARYADQNGTTTLQELLQDKFLDSPRISCSSEKLAGIILLKHQKGTPTDSQETKLDFSWAHTTQTMAVGYMALGDQTPEELPDEGSIEMSNFALLFQFQLTRLGADAPRGSSIVTRGIVKTQQLSSMNGEDN